MTSYLVTGCAGFIGSHLAEELVARGDSVVGIDRFTDYYAREKKEENVELLRALGSDRFTFSAVDLAADELEPLLEPVDAVFHLAGQPGVRDSWAAFDLYLRENLLATQRLFTAASGLGKRVVMASTSSVYGNAERYPTSEEVRARPISPYGVTKLACERLADAYADEFRLEAVSLRYFTVFGPRQRPDMAFARITRALMTGEIFHVFGTGRQSRDFTYVTDAVSATIAAMDRAPAGRIYNVGGGSEASLDEVIATCERISGRVLQVRREHAAAGDVRRTAADTTLIRTELDWAPRVTLEEGLAAQLAELLPDAASAVDDRPPRGTRADHAS
jgi:nucleoside-diphosphate-sugar epimerase